jgi:hypothetical protein
MVKNRMKDQGEQIQRLNHQVPNQKNKINFYSII